MQGKHHSKVDPHKGHWERLRTRFRQGGFAGFHDYEVVELLLTLARVRGDTKAIGKEAVKAFGSVKGVFDASPTQLQSIHGIGPRSAETIKLVRALAEYYIGDRTLGHSAPLLNSQSVADYLRVAMGRLDREIFRVVYVDAQNRPIKEETLFEGTLTSSVVYPREVLKNALAHGAVSLVLAHNHPSGCVEPSPEDRRITDDLVLAASYMDIHILDHVIVGTNAHFSFADHGLMQEYRKRARDFQERRRTM